MGLGIKALIGALVVILIGVLSKSRNYYIAGLVPLFPTFALIAHYIVGTERSLEDLRTTILFGMWAVFPYMAYLVSLYILLGYVKLPTALTAAVICWLAAAWLLILAWNRWHGQG